MVVVLFGFGDLDGVRGSAVFLFLVFDFFLLGVLLLVETFLFLLVVAAPPAIDAKYFFLSGQHVAHHLSLGPA